MKCILFLKKKKGSEEEYKFNSDNTEEATKKAKGIIVGEWMERQKEFPFIPEPLSEPTLFCEIPVGKGIIIEGPIENGKKKRSVKFD